MLLFMYISISIYQSNYKTNQITELNKIVESEREIIKDISEKNYPKLENKINDLVNLEKCKKLNTELMIKNTGINYLANKISQNVKNADVKKHSKEYDDLLNERVELSAQISNLQNNPLTINILTQLNQQDKPLHQQIKYLEQKAKDNYQNRMILINKIKKLETNEKVKYILSNLDKNNAPLNEQITAINRELGKLNNNNPLGEHYNTNTKYILEKLNQNNRPVNQQIEVLRESLENKNLLLEIDRLKQELAKNLKTGNEPLNLTNLTKTLNNLQEIKNNPSRPYNQNSTNVLEQIGMNDKPIDQQINKLKNTLDLDKNLKKELANNLKIGDENLNTDSMEKALNNLQDIKNNHTNSYNPNSKKVLNKMGMNNIPLDEQINKIKNKLDLDKLLKKQLTNNLKIDNENLNTDDIKKSLNNLQDIKNNHTNDYTPNSKAILKKLDINNKPLNEQINKLKNKLDLDERLKEQLANNLKTKDDNLDANNLKKALSNLNDIKNNHTNSYNPNSKAILNKMGVNNIPLDEQINKLKNKLDLDKRLKEQLANNLKTKNDNLDANDLKKALSNLEGIKDNNTNSYNPNSKAILKKMGVNNKPLVEQINKLKDKLDKNKKINKQITILEKQINKNPLSKNSNLREEDIKEALKNLNKMKDTNTNTYANADKVYIDKLKNALDSITEIQNLKNKLANKKDIKPVLNTNIENAIKYLEDKEKQPNLKANKDVQSTLDKFNIKGKPSNEQLSNLYLNLYSTPSNNTNVSELNFVINRLNNQNDLNNRIKYINNFLEQSTNTTNDYPQYNRTKKDGEDKSSKKEIETLKNQVKYLQKKIEKSGVSHLPCILDNEGSSIFLFRLSLRDDNINVQLGSHEKIKELSKDIPNLDKLIDKTMSLKKFMKLTKPIFEQSVQDECRQFVYFKDETVSKKEYKRKTLTIQHHFYKYIDHSW